MLMAERKQDTDEAGIVLPTKWNKAVASEKYEQMSKQ